MKISELIDYLNNYDSDLEVVTTIDEDEIYDVVNVKIEVIQWDYPIVMICTTLVES